MTSSSGTLPEGQTKALQSMSRYLLTFQTWGGKNWEKSEELVRRFNQSQDCFEESHTALHGRKLQVQMAKILSLMKSVERNEYQCLVKKSGLDPDVVHRVYSMADSLERLRKKPDDLGVVVHSLLLVGAADLAHETSAERVACTGPGDTSEDQRRRVFDLYQFMNQLEDMQEIRRALEVQKTIENTINNTKDYIPRLELALFWFDVSKNRQLVSPAFEARGLLKAVASNNRRAWITMTKAMQVLGLRNGAEGAAIFAKQLCEKRKDQNATMQAVQGIFPAIEIKDDVSL